MALPRMIQRRAKSNDAALFMDRRSEVKTATPIKGYRVDKNGKLVKIDKRNLIQKLQSSTKKKWKPAKTEKAGSPN